MGELNGLSVYVFFLNETFELPVKVRLPIRIVALNDSRNFQNAFRNRLDESVGIEPEKFY